MLEVLLCYYDISLTKAKLIYLRDVVPALKLMKEIMDLCSALIFHIWYQLGSIVLGISKHLKVKRTIIIINSILNNLLMILTRPDLLLRINLYYNFYSLGAKVNFKINNMDIQMNYRYSGTNQTCFRDYVAVSFIL